MNRRPPIPATIPHLPHDLIIDIFSRLPAESLMRFRYVCKPWYNSIADPKFIKLHLSRAIEQGTSSLLLSTKPIYTKRSPLMASQLYCLRGDSFAESVQIENPLNFKLDVGFMSLGSCNGVVCFANENIVCLLNPTTREYKVIEFERDLGWGRIDEDLGRTAYGLGYDESIEDYILVLFVTSAESLGDDAFDFESEISVHSPNDTFSSKLCNIPYGIESGHRMGIYLYGCLHWVVQRSRYLPFAIIAFHNTEKVVKEIQLPHVLRDPYFTLGILGGNICILSNFDVGNSEIWVMKKYDVVNSWVKLFSCLYAGPDTRALCFSKNDKVLLMDVDQHILYQPQPSRLWNINYLNIAWPRLDRSVTYIASLVPLNSGRFVAVVDGVKPTLKRELTWLMRMVRHIPRVF